MIQVGRTSDRLGIAFKALTASFAIGGILRASDAYTTVNNRLKLVTASQEELAIAYKKVFQLAQETRGPLEATARFYAQLSLSAKTLKLSQEDMITVTGTLNKVIALTGQSAEASSNALIQLQQSIGSGVLRGDELRSIMEQLPLLGQIIADSMGIAYGQLKTVGQEGRITAKIVTDALVASADDIDKAFHKMNFTFGQAFIILYNGFVNTIGQINEATGLFSGLAKGIASAGYYFTGLAQAIGGVAVAIAAVKAAQFIAYMNSATVISTSFVGGMTRSVAIVTVFQAGLIRAGAAMLALRDATIAFMISNPFTALIAGLAIVLPLLYYFRDSIILSRDGTVTLGTVFNSVFAMMQAALPIILTALSEVGKVIYDIAAAVGTAFIPIWQAVQSVFDALRPSIEAIIGAFGGTVTKVTALSFAFAAMVAVFNPWIAAVIAVVAALNTVDPGLAKTTFALTLMGEAIGFLIKLALVPLVVAFDTLVQIMGAFGAVTPEVARSVDAQSQAFMKNAGSLEGMTARIQVAYDAMVKQEATISSTKESAGLWANVLDTKLNPALSKTADSSVKTAGAAGKLATGVDNINRSLDITPDKVKPVIDSFAESVKAANENTAAIDKLTEAYKRLHAVQNGGAPVSGTPKISGAMAADITPKAKGGNVRGGTTYLVGEKGPELFTPDRSGAIISNKHMQGAGAYKAMSTASNDNRSPRHASAASTATTAVVKQITVMGTSVVSSNKEVVAATKKLTLTNAESSNLVKKVAYAVPTMADRAAKTIDNTVRTFGGGNVSDFGMYNRKDGSVPLPGDADYQSNNKFMGTVVTSGIGDKGLFYSMVDQAMPMWRELFQAQAKQAYLGGHGYDDLVKLQTQMIDSMKQIRDNTATFKAFKLDLKAQRNTPGPKIDFQTLFPGVDPLKYTNPYHLGESASSPKSSSVMPSSTSKSSNSKGEGADKPTQINMVVVTPNAESFRQNQAQIEGKVYGMVKRAQRRAGG